MKATIISIIIAAVIIGGVILLTKNNGSPDIVVDKSNVSVENGKQIIDIFARGGYSPRKTVAQAGVPTIISVTTKGSFDCSIALSIPSIGYRKNLPSTAVTEIEIPAQSKGSSMQGICAMGMYNFLINFD